jgi:hypothetical protein
VPQSASHKQKQGHGVGLGGNERAARLAIGGDARSSAARGEQLGVAEFIQKVQEASRGHGGALGTSDEGGDAEAGEN